MASPRFTFLVKLPILRRLSKKTMGWGLFSLGVLICLFFLYPMRKNLCITDAFIETNSITIPAKHSGAIVKRYVSEGDFVKRGQLLLELDDRKFQADIRYVEAEIQHAKNELQVCRIHQEKVMLSYLSGRQKFDAQELSQEELDSYVKDMEEAQALYNKETARIAVLEAKLNVYRLKNEATKIYSPCEGVITKEFQLIGDFVRKGQEVFTMYDLSNVWVQAHVSESKIHCVRLEDTVQIKLSSYPNLKFSGKVFSISPAIYREEHSRSRLVPVRVSIHQDGEESKVSLRPGMIASIDIHK